MKIPVQIAELFDKESAEVNHGSIILTLHLRDGHPRFVITKEISIIPGTDARKEGEKRPIYYGNPPLQNYQTKNLQQLVKKSEKSKKKKTYPLIPC
jgi:hypothetical protein